MVDAPVILFIKFENHIPNYIRQERLGGGVGSVGCLAVQLPVSSWNGLTIRAKLFNQQIPTINFPVMQPNA